MKIFSIYKYTFFRNINGLAERNWVFATNSDFLILKSLHPNVVLLWLNNLSLKNQQSTPSGAKI